MDMKTPNNHIMLDLETMSTQPNAAIVAIGAVRFDLTGLKEHFYCAVELKSCLDIGLVTDEKTIKWWAKQSDEAQNALLDNPFKITRALIDLADFMDKNATVWGNGSDFDNVILSQAYKHNDLKLPWPYFNNMCYRTVKNMHPQIKLTRVGAHHNALDDAKSQAEHLIKILQVIQ